MKKAALETPRTGDSALDRFLAATKQNLDQITGQTKTSRYLAPLPATATLAQVIERVNAIAERIQSDPS
jgi:hypothetical protein